MTDKAVQKLHSQAATEYFHAMKNLLGDSGYQQLQDYERSSGCRAMLSDVSASALATGTTFSSQQLEQLVSILANSTPKFAGGGHADTQAIDWEIVDAQARTILTEDQFAAFSALATNSGRINSKLSRVIAAAIKADEEALKSRAAPE